MIVVVSVLSIKFPFLNFSGFSKVKRRSICSVTTITSDTINYSLSLKGPVQDFVFFIWFTKNPGSFLNVLPSRISVLLWVEFHIGHESRPCKYQGVSLF